MANHRGPMGYCLHTNDNFYGSNGCRACDRDYADWKASQEKAAQEAKIERMQQEIDELKEKVNGKSSESKT